MASERQSFWTTLPGILTALGAIIGALASLLAVLHSVGWIGIEQSRGGAPVNAAHRATERVDSATTTHAQEEHALASDIERAKIATKRAWNQIQSIDEEFIGERQVITSETVIEVSLHRKEQLDAYERIDLQDVDPLLKDHVKANIALLRAYSALFADVRSSMTAASQMDDNEAKALQVRLNGRAQDLNERSRDLDARDKHLARVLSEKYRISLYDKY